MSPRLSRLLPGTALCAAIAAIAMLLQQLQGHLFGQPGIDALVLAILLGIGARTALRPKPAFTPGIDFSARTVLEVAVALLGLSVSFAEVARAGLPLLAAIVGVVIVTIVSSFAICHFLGIGARMAVLIACGNAICGNSAIAAVAPAVRATSEDVVSAVAFSAILGVALVLLLPLAIPLAGLSDYQYGILAGLTIYAVPQVMAAAAPVSLQAAQIATLVKLVRVLMLGPVVMIMAFVARSLPDAMSDAQVRPGVRTSNVWQMVPPFIPAFLLLALLRTMNLVPDLVVDCSVVASKLLSTIAMAALGLCVDVGQVVRLSARLTLAVSLSLAVLVAASLVVVRFIGGGA